MNKNLPQKADKKSSALAKPSSLAVRPLNPQEVRLRPAPVWSRALAWTIIGSASFAFVFACFAKIDEVVLAVGELQPLGAERPLKAPFAGMVKEILVTEGQEVVAGQALIRMDTEVSEKRKETLERQYELEENRFTEETRSFRAREQSLQERMDGLSRALATEREIYAAIVPLAAQGFSGCRCSSKKTASSSCNRKLPRPKPTCRKCRLSC